LFRPGLERTIYALEASTLTIMPPMRLATNKRQAQLLLNVVVFLSFFLIDVLV
jgi:hypothetical protein